jgi:hypothetical protein
MSVNVKLANVLIAPGLAAGDPERDEYRDGDGIHYSYEVLPGGALAVLEFDQEQVRTAITYAAAAWLTVDGKRRGDQR